MTKEEIIQRIKKLKAHAESAEQIGSLEEAKIFMSKVNELMNEYNVSLFELDQAKTDDDVLKNFSYVEKVSYKDGTYYKYRFDLIKVISKHNFTKVIFNTEHKYFAVYGNAFNVDNTIWQYWYAAILLKNLALQEYRNFRHENRFRFISDYLLAAVKGLNFALKEQAQKNNKVTDLILYNNKLVEKYIEKLGVETVTFKSRNRQTVGIGSILGYEAGKKIDFTEKKLGK